jgi:inner membrane protease subunit 2
MARRVFGQWGRSAISWVAPVGGTAAGVYVFYTRVGSIQRVSGTSMEPTLHGAGGGSFFTDWVLVSKLMFDPYSDVRVGDVVVFTAPNNPDRLLVKRITAMPHQFSRYRSPATQQLSLAYVKPGHCWVQGDNDRVSIDSRQFGPVPLGHILGKANVILFPPWRLRSISDATQ